MDDKTEYTSAASMVWTPGETTGEFVQVFTTENYGENVYDGSDLLTEDSTPGFFAEDKVSGIEGKKTSDWNINNQNGELTFWFIPQVLTDDVKLEITYYIDAGGRIGNEVTKTIDFGTLTKNADWKAGQLRTYVLKANEVDVEITDELSSNVKSNVKITNLGNVPQFVRATIVAYWAAPETQNPYDASSPLVAVFGYESETSDNFVAPWSLQGELGNVSGYTPYGTIDTFYPETDQTNWSTSSHDGYYYYKNVIGVDEAYTNVMFKRYTLDESKIPEIWQIDQKTLQRTQLQGVRLVMEIVCQAVIAKENGTDYVSWNEAWEEALGYNPAE